MAVFYLDVDDEITSAAQRIRSTTDRTVALVLPAGSRLATSRINFRLLAREAGERARSLVIVAPDASARALAASAGLPVYATVADYEAEASGASAAGSGPSAVGGAAAGAAGVAGAAGAGAADAAVVTRAAGATQADGRAKGGSSGTGTSGAAGRDASATRTVALPPPVATRPGARSSAAAAGGVEVARAVRPRRLGLWLGAAALALLAVVGGAAAYLLLPSASIVIVPKEEAVGPVSLTVKADPTVSSPDPAGSVVPAQSRTFPLQVQGEFTATGVKVTETKATGMVTFSNYNTGGNANIPAGSVVSTSGGIEFATTSQLILGPASLVFPGPTDVPTTGAVGVQAVTLGTSGNVAAGAIKIVPSNQNPVLLHVKNAAPTSGGTHTETKVVGQKDVDGAIAQLKKQLADQFTAQLGDPASTPAGLTLFPDTKSMTDPTYSVDPKTLVGQAKSTFQLTATATGSVTAVDQEAVKQLAEGRVQALVPADHQLVAGSIAVQVGEGKAAGQTVTFPVTATGTDAKTLDATALREAIKGKPVADARAYLDQFGQVQLDVWPGWTTTIPTYDFRLDLSVRPAHASAPASPGPGVGSSEAPGGSANPSAASPASPVASAVPSAP